MAKKSLTQELLEQIMTTQKVSLSEAWKIYREKYEDQELSPNRVRNFVSKPIASKNPSSISLS